MIKEELNFKLKYNNLHSQLDLCDLIVDSLLDDVANKLNIDKKIMVGINRSSLPVKNRVPYTAGVGMICDILFYAGFRLDTLKESFLFKSHQAIIYVIKRYNSKLREEYELKELHEKCLNKVINLIDLYV
jgi:hypothetical protein